MSVSALSGIGSLSSLIPSNIDAAIASRSIAYSGSTVAEATTFAPSMPTKVAGDVLVIVHSWYSVAGLDRTHSALSGWTLSTFTYTGTGHGMAILYKISDGTETPTLTLSGNAIHACTVFSFNGATGIDLVGSFAAGATNGSPPFITIPAIVTTGPNRVLVSVASHRVNTTINVNAGQTATTQSSGTETSVFVSHKAGYETVAVAGSTGTRVFTSTGMNTNAALGVNFAVK